MAWCEELATIFRKQIGQKLAKIAQNSLLYPKCPSDRGSLSQLGIKVTDHILKAAGIQVRGEKKSGREDHPGAFPVSSHCFSPHVKSFLSCQEGRRSKQNVRLTLTIIPIIHDGTF